MSEVNITANEPQMNIEINAESTSNTINTAVSGDPYYAGLAKEWATKLNGKVLSDDYSAKYYALQAKELVTGVTNEVEEAEKQAIYNILTQQNNAIGQLEDKIEKLSEEFEEHTTNISDNIKDTINTTGTEQVTNITDTANNYITEMVTIKDDVNNAKTEVQEIVLNASISETNSENNAELAKQWAISEIIVEDTDYSAKYYAQKAKDYSNSYTKAEIDTLLAKKGNVLTPVEPISIKTYTKSALKGFSYTDDSKGIYSTSQFGVNTNTQTWYKTLDKTGDGNNLNWTTVNPNSKEAYPSYIDIPYTFGQVVKVPSQYNGANGATYQSIAIFGHLTKEGDFYPIVFIGESEIINGYSEFQTRSANTIYFARALSDGGRYSFTSVSKTDTGSSNLRNSGKYLYAQLNKNSGNINYNTLSKIGTSIDCQKYTVDSNIAFEILNKINVCRILPYIYYHSNYGVYYSHGYNSATPYEVKNFGLYSVENELYNLPNNVEEYINSYNNEFVIDEVKSENYLELAIDNKTVQVVGGKLVANIDTSNLATVTQLGTKQDVLIAGENITIENNVISATGGGLGLDLFDVIEKDHILTYEESKGLALLGSYVYKEAVAGSRYGYADFYNKVVEEYQNTTVDKPNVNITGSLSCVDGVLSGFSPNAYARMKSYYTGTINSLEWVMCATMPTSTPESYQVIAGQSSNNYSTPQFEILSGNYLQIIASTDGSTWDIKLKSDSAVTLGKKYWLKLIYNNTTGYEFHISENGVTYTLLKSSATTTAPKWSEVAEIGSDIATSAFAGSIDLNGCYININGKRWWNGGLTYKNSNGHIFYDIADKDAVDAFYETYGVAWYYGVDTENERVFLPRNDWFTQGGSESDVGKFVDAGLPNITGGFVVGRGDAYHCIIDYVDGCFTKSNYGAGIYLTASARDNGHKVSIDASRSNSTYGKSNTVQPKAVKKLVYMCVGNTEVSEAVTGITEVTTTENDTTPLFTGLYFDFTPNNVSWLKAGQQANSGGIYEFVYNELVNELTTPKYGLKVIETKDMVSGEDYSLYWKVNQDDMTFTTPTAISNKALSGAVVGNNKPIGLTNGTNTYVLAGGLAGGTENARKYLGQGAYAGTTVGGKVSLLALSGDTALGLTETARDSGIIAQESTAQLYFKVANAVQNLELLDAGEVLESLSDKISRQDCKAYVTETYKNGTSWYRVYSDGWCEQGGFGGGTTGTISLLKPMVDTNYQILCQKSGKSQFPIAVIGRTATSFTVDWDYGSTTKTNGWWQASGYIA